MPPLKHLQEAGLNYHGWIIIDNEKPFIIMKAIINQVMDLPVINFFCSSSTVSPFRIYQTNFNKSFSIYRQTEANQ